MTVIYFTDAALIDHVLIRRSLLRIPEIMEALRISQNEFVNCDLHLAMNEESVYKKLNYHQKAHLKATLQNALYKRWYKKGQEPDLILKRKDYLHFNDLAHVFQKLSTLDELNVVTIGPGFDELESFLRLRLKLGQAPLNEFISQDPHLNWFWPDFRNSLIQNYQMHS